jgi:hypothetical protein
LPEEGLAVGHPGDWDYLWLQLKRRTPEPLGDVPFVFYVFLGIVIFGGLGIWVELLKILISTKPAELAGLITAVNTFFPALILEPEAYPGPATAYMS